MQEVFSYIFLSILFFFSINYYVVVVCRMNAVNMFFFFYFFIVPCSSFMFVMLRYLVEIFIDMFFS